MNKHVVILAAGMGSRLGNREAPKPLTLLANEKSILQMQIERLLQHVSIDQITLVVGYKFEMLMRAFPDLAFVYNPHYAKENTSKSLLRAAKKIVNQDLIWINGDVVFADDVLVPLFNTDVTAMLVNHGSIDEEAVKYRLNEKGLIAEVSKKVQDPQGEAVGINLFKNKDLSLLLAKLAECEDNDYFEKAIELCIQQGSQVRPISIEAKSCIEIDFPEDLAKANQMFCF